MPGQEIDGARRRPHELRDRAGQNLLARGRYDDLAPAREEHGAVVVVHTVVVGALRMAVEVDEFEGQLRTVIAHELEKVDGALAVAAPVEELDPQRLVDVVEDLQGPGRKRESSLRREVEPAIGEFGEGLHRDRGRQHGDERQRERDPVARSDAHRTPRQRRAPRTSSVHARKVALKSRRKLTSRVSTPPRAKV